MSRRCLLPSQVIIISILKTYLMLHSQKQKPHRAKQGAEKCSSRLSESVNHHWKPQIVINLEYLWSVK